MSDARRTGRDPADAGVWTALAEHRDTLEMLVAEETAFAERAERLLARLEEEGY